MIASEKGHLATTQRLLRSHADVQARSDSGKTALFSACERNHAELALALVAAGADASLGTRHHRTPVHLAVEHGMTALLRAIVQSPSARWEAVLSDPKARNSLVKLVDRCSRRVREQGGETRVSRSPRGLE